MGVGPNLEHQSTVCSEFDRHPLLPGTHHQMKGLWEAFGYCASIVGRSCPVSCHDPTAVPGSSKFFGTCKNVCLHWLVLQTGGHFAVGHLLPGPSKSGGLWTPRPHLRLFGYSKTPQTGPGSSRPLSPLTELQRLRRPKELHRRGPCQPLVDGGVGAAGLRAGALHEPAGHGLE